VNQEFKLRKMDYLEKIANLQENINKGRSWEAMGML
jgi:hypothetical protein